MIAYTRIETVSKPLKKKPREPLDAAIPGCDSRLRRGRRGSRSNFTPFLPLVALSAAPSSPRPDRFTTSKRSFGLARVGEMVGGGGGGGRVVYGFFGVGGGGGGVV